MRSGNSWSLPHLAVGLAAVVGHAVAVEVAADAPHRRRPLERVAVARLGRVLLVDG
jgi:hypothetical protein